ncbi:MAG: glycosyltransferase family 4 protein [Patescibacteria group bacterium]
MLQKSRVLMLTTAYLPQVGGSELAIKNITDRLPSICFDLITSRFSKNILEYEKMGSVNVYRVGGSFGLSSFLLPKNFFPIAVFFKACQLIRKHGSYDAIHAYQASQAAGGGWLLKWRYPHIPFMVTVQEGKVLNKQSLLIRFFRYLIFRKANAVTVISNYLGQYVRSQNPKIPISIIPNGVDLNKFKQRDNKVDSKTIITVSRLVKKNGVGDLIDAMAVVRNEIPDAKLMIVGDGPLGGSLKLKVKNLNMENSIQFLGEISNDSIPEYLAKADIFVRPSLSEGLGSAFLEAMAAGLPIIGTRVGGIPDFLKDGETGLFCKVADPKDLTEKIVRILKDEQLREKIINNGKALVVQKYDWNIIAIEFREIYNKFSI